jgi:hypothetical protein
MEAQLNNGRSKKYYHAEKVAGKREGGKDSKRDGGKNERKLPLFTKCFLPTLDKQLSSKDSCCTGEERWEEIFRSRKNNMKIMKCLTSIR